MGEKMGEKKLGGQGSVRKGQGQTGECGIAKDS